MQNKIVVKVFIHGEEWLEKEYAISGLDTADMHPFLPSETSDKTLYDLLEEGYDNFLKEDNDDINQEYKSHVQS